MYLDLGEVPLLVHVLTPQSIVTGHFHYKCFARFTLVVLVTSAELELIRSMGKFAFIAIPARSIKFVLLTELSLVFTLI